MTHVQSTGPWEAGSGGIDPDKGPKAELEALPEPTDAPASQDHAELLMGFLSDFHAASREPPPEPDQVTAAPPASELSPLSRFDFAPRERHDLLPVAPLPVWPPPPQYDDAASTEPSGAMEAPATPPADEPEGTEGSKRGTGVFRRFGRR